METSIKLQEPFSYSLVPIVVIGLIVLIYAIFLIVKKIKNKDKKVIVQQKVECVVDVLTVKKQYIAKLTNIETMYENGDITSKEAYQKTSEYVREFVQKLTNINVSNCTLQDIIELNMPLLANLVSEYYRPEFEKEFEGNIRSSIQKTKRAIEEWR